MQISPSANLFRALGGLPQAQQAAGARPAAPAVQEIPRGNERRPLHQAPQAALASGAAPAQPTANLPRGSLINLKV